MNTVALPPLETAVRPRLRRVPERRRRVLEAAGWRTWLTYRENHRRDASGRMVAIEQRWVVELEHADSRSIVVEAPSPAAAWLAASQRANAFTSCPDHESS